MPSQKLLVVALATLVAPFVNAGPCKASTLPATDSTTYVGVTSTTAAATTSYTTTAAATTTAPPVLTCTEYDPEPAYLHCGGFGNPSGGSIITTVQANSLDDCALACHNNNECNTFDYFGTNCRLYAEAGSLLKRLPTTVGPPWYDIECFGCGTAAPVSTSVMPPP
ncbi:hypothetical protein BGZ63DRAFT_393062 [Mariannaea sp. PMI_226]|nr:hypothetical protein BGZ63DRAFT_393062 [Mariannaea sp. PMI_226]